MVSVSHARAGGVVTILYPLDNLLFFVLGGAMSNSLLIDETCSLDSWPGHYI